MARADTNFAKSITDLLNAEPDADKPAAIIDGERFEFYQLGNHRSLGFHEGVFVNNQGVASGGRLGFWIKPDLLLKSDNKIVPVEHCCSWQNFYQKRFAYSAKIAEFEASIDGPIFKAEYEIHRVVYILKGNLGEKKDQGFYKRLISAGPNLPHERFLFEYENWHEKNWDKKPFDMKIFDRLLSKKTIVD